MKKELFNRIVAYLTAELGESKVTIKDDFESVCFTIRDNTEKINTLKEAIALDKANQAALLRDYRFSSGYDLVNQYYTVLYNSVKDKISISTYEAGWAWADKKSRFYPFKRQIPSLCYSKNLYTFMSWRVSVSKYTFKPRLLKGQDVGGGYEWTGEIAKMMMNIDFKPTMNVTAKHYMNAKDEWEVIYRKTGIKVPKALKMFPVAEISDLITALANPNELNTLCQHLITYKSIKSSDSHTDVLTSMDTIVPNLYAHLAHKLFKNTDASWLMRDYIQDLIKLKRTFSLRMTSKTRIEEEHRKMTKEIMIMGIKAINVHEHYKEMFKNFPIPNAELILDKKRLMKESIDQDHCVASYGHRINSGECCIVSLPWEGVQYTMQINALNAGGQRMYAIQQCQGFRNKVIVPVEMMNVVRKHFNTEFDLIRSEQVPVYQEENLPF
jgi:hypothetical protein